MTVEQEKVTYTAKTHTTGGRAGASRSDDGRLDVKLSIPGAARKMKMTLPAETAIDAEVDLCNNDGAYFLQARLNVNLPGLDREVAQAIVDAAHQICPYSKATRGNIDVAINLI